MQLMGTLTAGAVHVIAAVGAQVHLDPGEGGPAVASARTSLPAPWSRKIPSGPTNLSAFHSIGLWLAVMISPAPA